MRIEWQSSQDETPREAATAADHSLAHEMIGAYATGWFAVDKNPDGRMVWRTVERRAVIQPSEELVARVRRSFRPDKWAFVVRPDEDFDAVLDACSGRRNGVLWLTERLCDAYRALRDMRLGRSVAVYDSGGDLVGGTLLVTIGGAGFAESTFHRASNAGNAAMLAVVELLFQEGRRLLDLQYLAGEHFRRFGAVEVTRAEYLELLWEALEPPEPRVVHVPRHLRDGAATDLGGT